MKIVQVHAADLGGGAEEMAYLLHRRFCELGHDSYLVVGRKRRGDARVVELPSHQRWRGEFRLKRFLERLLGLQYLYAPASSRIRDVVPVQPDAVLLHSLHGGGGYFDIQDLVRISRAQNTFLYLQDQWLMTGHCAYSLGCGRWKTGCGKCPDLTISPALKKDGTRLNWIRKKLSLRRSNLVVGSPARWILGLAKESPLLSRFKQFYIPNAVDLKVFHPEDKRAARARLGLNTEEQFVLFLAQKGSNSVFKDFSTLASAFHKLRASGCRARLVTVGGAQDEATRAALPNDVIFHPFTADRTIIADYYRAADIFCHATKADVCPLTIIEAQACGTPVIGTAIGGVPEIIVEGVTGWTVPLGDVDLLTERLSQALSDPSKLKQMGLAAAEHAMSTFGIENITDQFVTMFENSRKTAQ